MAEDSAKPKLFVSLPMKGKTESEIRQKMEEIHKLVSNKYDLIDTVWTEEPPNPNNPIWYLGKSIQMLGEADLVVFTRDWSVANGCRVEREVCNLYGIPYVDEIDLMRSIALRGGSI